MITLRVLSLAAAVATVAATAALATSARAAERLDCAALGSAPIPAAAIGLPTSGADVTTAVRVATSGQGPRAVGDYCLVSGLIHPVDPRAPDIRFEVALPDAWNGKALMLGGGGFDGAVPKLAAAPYNLAPSAGSPLGRGYAVFGGDSGHTATEIEPGAFLMNDEAYLNWMGDALKKTRDAAIAVIDRAYRKKPSHSYFLGGSSGGREGLMVAGRWPQDWDGVVALYPARNQMVEILGGQNINLGFAVPGAHPSPAKRGVLLEAALEMCDGFDGATDRLISDVRRCNAVFDPATATLRGAPLRCPGGADTGDTCLSDLQIAALRNMHDRFDFNTPLANGETSFPGYNVYTADLGVPSASPLRAMVSMMAVGEIAPGYPAKPGMSLAATFGDNFIRYGIARDPNFNPLTFNPSNPGQLAGRITEMSRLDLADRDLTAFARRRGKLILLHGLSDTIVSPRISEDYYKQLRGTMGSDTVDGFMRFYEAPGFGHALGTSFALAWDYLAALEAWSERGVDPADKEVVMDLVGVPGRTRPLCPYPQWPKYAGSGDVNSAASFTCASH